MKVLCCVLEHPLGRYLLVQPRKTRPGITEKLLTESKQKSEKCTMSGRSLQSLVNWHTAKTS